MNHAVSSFRTSSGLYSNDQSRTTPTNPYSHKTLSKDYHRSNQASRRSWKKLNTLESEDEEALIDKYFDIANVTRIQSIGH